MTQHYLLQNAYGSFSAGEDAEDGGSLSSVFSAEVEKAKIICRCKWSAVSTAIASPCQNKLLLVPPKSRMQLLEEFSDEVTRVLACFAGLWAVVLPRPLGTEHVYCAAMMIPFGTVRQCGFTCITCDSSKSPEWQQNCPESEATEQRILLCLVWDSVRSRCNVYFSKHNKFSQGSLNESLFCSLSRACSLQRRVTWLKINSAWDLSLGLQ